MELERRRRACRRGGVLSDWYVFQLDAAALGPWSTEVVADAILSGNLAPDIWVASPGGQRWVRALEVPVIASIVQGNPTRPKRFDSGMRSIPGLLAPDPGSGEPPSTVKRLDDTLEMTSLPAMSVRLPPESDEEDPPPARAPLPPPSTPTPTPRKATG